MKVAWARLAGPRRTEGTTIDGYTGKILRVDLTNRKSSAEPVPEEWRSDYLGGKGLAYRHLLDNLARGLDPLAPESEIVFMTGPLAGTLVPTSSRMAVVARSPSTGKPLYSVVGGGAAAELKFAGYDGIVVTGRANASTFLYVTDQRVTFERAGTLWGMGAEEAERTIQEKKWTFGARTLTIGPEGESMIPSAGLTADGHPWGRSSGFGAVMGSKNLKAVVVRGQAGVRVADMPGFLTSILEHWGVGARSDGGLWADAEGTMACTSCPVGCRSLSVGTVPGVSTHEEASIWDSLVVCGLWRPPLEALAEAFGMVTGIFTTSEALRRTGESIEALERSVGDSAPW